MIYLDSWASEGIFLGVGKIFHGKKAKGHNFYSKSRIQDFPFCLPKRLPMPGLPYHRLQKRVNR